MLTHVHEEVNECFTLLFEKFLARTGGDMSDKASVLERNEALREILLAERDGRVPMLDHADLLADLYQTGIS
jgi:hypothetical protein